MYMLVVNKTSGLGEHHSLFMVVVCKELCQFVCRILMYVQYSGNFVLDYFFSSNLPVVHQW